MLAEDLVQELTKALIIWYEFCDGSEVLFVMDESGTFNVLKEVFIEKNLELNCTTINEIEKNENIFVNSRFDYIFLAGALEYSQFPEKVLRILHELLKSNGRLLLGMDNRLGIRYFCGDRDPFSGHIFDGIENYSKLTKVECEKMKGRLYAKSEIIEMLENAGFNYHRFYSVLPDITRPQMLFVEDYLPGEELDVRIVAQYHNPNTIFLEEEGLYTTLIKNGLFHAMANGYFIECPIECHFANIKQVTISMDRGPEEALATIIRRDGLVEKKALYKEGREKLKRLLENTQDLECHGVKMVNAKLDNNSFVMPFVHGESVTKYFRRILCEDKEFFFHEFDRFWELIKSSSDHISYNDVDWNHFDPDWQKHLNDEENRNRWKEIAFGPEKEDLGIILKRGYIDLVSLNCFYIDGDFVFYDQEFYIENLPANVILMRTIEFIYWENMQIEFILPKNELEKKYHLNKYSDIWRRFSDVFIEKLRNEKILINYHQLCRRNREMVRKNRYRMNFSEEEYNCLFNDIFKGIKGKDLYLFGSGIYAMKFLQRFNYDVVGFIDNDMVKCGTVINHIPVYSPEYLLSLEDDSYKVIICVKNFSPIIYQMEKMKIRNVSVYIPEIE